MFYRTDLRILGSMVAVAWIDHFPPTPLPYVREGNVFGLGVWERLFGKWGEWYDGNRRYGILTWATPLPCIGRGYFCGLRGGLLGKGFSDGGCWCGCSSVIRERRSG
jgi:hypothetical protein